MKRKLFKTVALLLSMSVIVTLAGCKGGSAGDNPVISAVTQGIGDMGNQDIECGGSVNNTDYDAPKEIKSKKLTKFTTNFFHSGEYGSEFDAMFYFNVEKGADGKIILSEDRQKVSCEVDESVFIMLQRIIDEFELAKSNGIHTFTYGLPPEFETCNFYALYDSGEYIDFSCNSNPYEDWSRKVRDYLAEVFNDHGIDVFMPPKETTTLTRFSMEFTAGDLKYTYGEILVPIEKLDMSLEEMVSSELDESLFEKQIYRQVWDRKNNKEVSMTYADPTWKFYDRLQEVIMSTDLEQFNNGQMFPTDFDFDNTPEYFEFYAEYAYGNRIYGFSDEAEANDYFKTVADDFQKYFDDYLDGEN